MVDVLRRERYDERRVLIGTARILNPQFKSTILCVSGAQLEVLRNLMEYLNRRTTFASEYFDRYYLSPTTNEWDSLLAIVADLEEKLMLIYVDDYVCLRDVKAQGEDGGTFTAGAWQTRDVNEEQTDSAGICSVSSNQITLEAGTYRCAISCPAHRVSTHQIRLQNVTDTVTLLLGTSMFAHYDYSVYNRSAIVGQFELSAQKTLEIQHRCSTTYAVVGFGVSADFADEVYTIAEFWRMIG